MRVFSSRPLAVARDVGGPVVVADFEALVRRHAPYVASIAVRILGRPADVDDVVQDVFFHASRGLPDLRDPGAVQPWLARVTVRVAMQRMRMRRFRSLLGLGDPGELDNLPAPGATPEQRLLIQAVYRVLDRLPMDQRVAWILRHVEGQELLEIAHTCGCSLAAVKRRLSAAQAVIARSVDAWKREEVSHG